MSNTKSPYQYKFQSWFVMNSKMFFCTRFIIVLTIVVGNVFYGTCQKSEKISIELLNAPLANSNRHFQFNTNERWYFEGRLGYKFSRYFEASASVGYQERDYIYFALFTQPAYAERPIIMTRHYIPIALNGRLYLSDFFYEKLHLWKKQDRWDVYMQGSLVSNRGHDVRDPNEPAIVALGGMVPFYKYPYVDVYKTIYCAYIAGVRYNFNKHIGLFVEGGEGLLMNAVIGASISF